MSSAVPQTDQITNRQKDFLFMLQSSPVHFLCKAQCQCPLQSDRQSVRYWQTDRLLTCTTVRSCPSPMTDTGSFIAVSVYSKVYWQSVWHWQTDRQTTYLYYSPVQSIPCDRHRSLRCSPRVPRSPIQDTRPL